MDAPEEVVGGLSPGRFLEGADGSTLRVGCAEDVAYNAVLAAGVECLQDNQQRLPAVGVQKILRLGETLDVFLDLRQGLFVRFVLAAIGRVKLVEPDFVPRFDEEFFAVIHEACCT